MAMTGGIVVGPPVGGPNSSTHTWDAATNQWVRKAPVSRESPAAPSGYGPQAPPQAPGMTNPSMTTLGGPSLTPQQQRAKEIQAQQVRAQQEREAQAQEDRVRQEGYAREDTVRKEANSRDDAKRRDVLDRIDREMNGAGTGGTVTGDPRPPSGGGGTVTPPATEQDARAAAFSRAKDQAGRVARSSLTAIAEQIASKGMSGASVQALQEAGAIGSADATLQDLTRDQMISDVNRAGSVADRNYAGDLTRRGQDMQNRQSYLSLLRGLY